MTTGHRILVLHGPTLSHLGRREPEFYGTKTLLDIDSALADEAKTLGATVECRQSNHEGTLIDWVLEAHSDFDGIVLNAAAYTHSSIGLRDALAAGATPCVEVHLSNTHAREAFRHSSLIASQCIGIIQGFREQSYILGLRGLIDYLNASGG